MVRLFIALELSDWQKKEVGEFQEMAKKYLQGVRWVKSENIHLTLKFLGDTEEKRVSLIRAAIDNACAGFRPFSISYGGAGVFPNERKARVFWVGLNEGLESLGELAGNLEEKMAAVGYEKEKRSFHPHLTIGRLKNPLPVNSVKKYLAAGTGFVTSSLIIDRVVLFESKLTRSGAVYSSLYKKDFF